jgi:hypothetical protein
MGEEFAQQSGIQLAQDPRRQLRAKLMQLTHVGQTAPMRQMSETAPRALLW